jgi:hypothetical protein
MTSHEEASVSNAEFRVIGIVLLVIFTVTLAVMVGNRMSVETLAVLIGLVCGVAASIPTGLLVMAVTRRPDSSPERRQSRNEQRFAHPSPQEYPPVIIVNPAGAGPTMSRWLPPTLPTLTSGEGRRFRVIGQEEEDIVTLDAEDFE